MSRHRVSVVSTEAIIQSPRATKSATGEAELSRSGIQLQACGCLRVAPQLSPLGFALCLAFGALEALAVDGDAAEALSTAPPFAVDVATLPPILIVLLVRTPSHQVLHVVVAVVLPAVVQAVEGFFGSLALLPVAGERLLLGRVAVFVQVVTLEIRLASERRRAAEGFKTDVTARRIARSARYFRSWFDGYHGRKTFNRSIIRLELPVRSLARIAARNEVVKLELKIRLVCWVARIVPLLVSYIGATICRTEEAIITQTFRTRGQRNIVLPVARF